MTAPNGLPPSLTRAESWRSRITKDGIVQQFGRFAVVGVSNTAISFAAYTILIGVGVFYWAAGGIAFALGAANGYILNRRWTFAAPDSTHARLRYVVVQAGGLGTTVALLWLFVASADFGRLSAYAITIPVVTLATFLANRGWTFEL
jgi:putative flippase GtrA